MNCKVCGEEMEEIGYENITMTKDRLTLLCYNCGRIFEYMVPPKSGKMLKSEFQ